MTDWSRAPSLLVAHAGTAQGHAALAPALAALEAWAARTGARLVGLRGRAPLAPADLTFGPDLAVTLPAETPWGAVVLSDPGHAAVEVGYALALAGVPRRAGFAPEFGGGALSHPVAPPPRGTPAGARHLSLLGALGLAGGRPAGSG